MLFEQGYGKDAAGIAMAAINHGKCLVIKCLINNQLIYSSYSEV